ncbi:hypothetical protein [uncultured Phascolarctobacterium sp.]|uniref:XkdQ/YqbQ family protein n=1 Tax=uncultured Phascolarctobacterium sp. TaxID=512296 RepID=UPI0027D977FE|nr:hypothetical protein [uncultured Phascolarctobacterium sp.]
MTAQIKIQNGDNIYVPAVLEGITLTTERYGTPSKLTFKVIDDGVLKFEEGNAVNFDYNGTPMFYGFVFTKKRDKQDVITVTCYDQLRYLKNKDTYVYENKTASELIQLIANDFNLQTGEIDDTKYKIASRVEDNQTLFDIIQNALDLTMENKKEIYVLYDDYGKITLKSLENMRVNILIDAETAENFNYASSIDDNTYNKIKLVYDNGETGKRDVYITQHGENINKWGVLQYYDTLQEGENGKAKAEALIQLYNQKTRTLQIKNALGDVNVRAGSLIGVSLDLGDVVLNNYMLVESCKHRFNLDEHFMDLTVRGGEFVG